jgi:transposase
MIAAYREPDRERGRELMRHLIDSISRGVPAALTEVITLGRTLTKRAADILAYFDRPGTSLRARFTPSARRIVRPPAWRGATRG